MCWEVPRRGADDSTLRRIVGGCARTAGSALRIRSGATRPAGEFRREGERRASRSLSHSGVSPGNRMPEQRQRARRCAGKFPRRRADDSTLRRIVGGCARTAGSALRIRSGATRPAGEFRREGERRASRSLSHSSVSPGNRVPEQRQNNEFQYFESGQAQLIQRKKLIGKPHAALWAVLRRGKAILCSVES